MPVEQQVEPGVVERFVDPYDVDERREVCPKASDRLETEAPANERIRFDENKRRRYQWSLTGLQVCEGALCAGVVLVLRIEQCEEPGRVREDGTHSNASSR